MDIIRRKKRIAAALLVLALLCAAAPVSRAADTPYVIALSPAEQELAVGKTALVTVAFSSDSALVRSYNALDLTLEYDSAALRFDVSRSVFPGTVVKTEANEAEGTLRVLLYGEDVPLSRGITLAFTVTAPGRTQILLTEAAVDRRVMADLRDALAPQIDRRTAEISASYYRVELPDWFAGESWAAYGARYTFIPRESGWEYSFAGSTSGGRSISVAGPDAKGVFFVEDVTGDIVIRAERRSASASPAPGGGSGLVSDTVAVTFAGSGRGELSGERRAMVGAAYYFYCDPEKGYEYSVTARMNGAPVEVARVGSYGFRVAEVTGALTITAEKTASREAAEPQNVEGDVSVKEYLLLDGGNRVYLVTVSGTPGAGKVFTYGGETMFWSEAYGAYAWLDVSRENLEGFAQTAYARLGYGVGKTAAIEYGGDAEWIWELCDPESAGKIPFSEEDFLRADVNGSGGVDILDAVAAAFLGRRGEERP